MFIHGKKYASPLLLAPLLNPVTYPVDFLF